jgi:hypothetical protein
MRNLLLAKPPGAPARLAARWRATSPAAIDAAGLGRIIQARAQSKAIRLRLELLECYAHAFPECLSAKHFQRSAGKLGNVFDHDIGPIIAVLVGLNPDPIYLKRVCLKHVSLKNATL